MQKITSVTALAALSVLTATAGAQCPTYEVVPAEAAAFDVFGRHVGVDGDRLLIGNPVHLIGGEALGAVYAFERGPTGWTETQKLVASDGEHLDFFGLRIAIDGDRALIAADGNDEPGIGRVGAGYVFEYEAGAWVEKAKLTPDLPNEGHISYEVALSGGTAFLGGEEVVAGKNCGVVYVFDGGGSELERDPAPEGLGRRAAERLRLRPGGGRGSALDRRGARCRRGRRGPGRGVRLRASRGRLDRDGEDRPRAHDSSDGVRHGPRRRRGPVRGDGSQRAPPDRQLRHGARLRPRRRHLDPGRHRAAGVARVRELVRLRQRRLPGRRPLPGRRARPDRSGRHRRRLPRLRAARRSLGARGDRPAGDPGPGLQPGRPGAPRRRPRAGRCGAARTSSPRTRARSPSTS